MTNLSYGSSYDSVYRASLNNPEEFWADAARGIDWIRQWDSVLDSEASPAARWFHGGQLNTCYNAVDRHADGERGDQAALIYDSAVSGASETLTYLELRRRVALFAGVLHECGVGQADRTLRICQGGRSTVGASDFTDHKRELSPVVATNIRDEVCEVRLIVYLLTFDRVALALMPKHADDIGCMACRLQCRQAR